MKKIVSTLFALSILSSTSLMADDLSVEVTNLSSGLHFTPIFVAAHASTQPIFKEGEAASTSLQAMAEGGDISGLSTDVQALGGNVVENPASGLLAPGVSTSFTLMTSDSNTHLSLTAMLLPTNDGFVGMDGLMLPTSTGTYTYYLNAYDAGTEANNEVINGGGTLGVLGIPADPGGNAGSNGTGITNTAENSQIHIHRGIVGDTDATGGESDLNSTVHRWLNPVARIVITVN